MSLQQAPQSRVFVELVPWADRGRENHLVSAAETLPGLRRPPSSAAAPTAPREVHVSGSTEVSACPDRARVAVRLSSTKAAAAEAWRSVGRRLDYVTQSLRRQDEQTENVTVMKDFRRVENAYHMEAEDKNPQFLWPLLIRNYLASHSLLKHPQLLCPPLAALAKGHHLLHLLECRF
ncbi:interleukin-1 receptor-associated kinase 1-binding protein 1-like [Manis pentadactyla]|uniref:interleukin-1 receptor-associated kinase 1-binding protein 1-like n=1 Tax=Manis pentadactyla TaxID=143292 RepID=UPI001876ED97|nr:interleukin-1 receptor-associated kinase 1-binding protein 1-like [Manis pentadactyla]